MSNTIANTQKLRRAAVFTDIHWGCKNNSDQHNQDCLDYIHWFCKNVRSNNCDHIMFLGDWFENRSAINVSTLNYSYTGAKAINDLGIPVFFVVGNHDLYHRHSRELSSTAHFAEFDNFVMIQEPTILNEVETSPLICPYLFHHEYPSLSQYTNVKTWWGHFEFKGFVVTGYSITMKTGPSHTDFIGPTYIFSGHFHKRQSSGNVVYVGNTFPTNFSDAGDTDRGMMVYDHISEKILFLNWEQCPSYVDTTLTRLLEGSVVLPANARVKCTIDVAISFEECSTIKNQFVDKFNLREFVPEETVSSSVITDSNGVVDELSGNIDDLIIQMLNSVQADRIDNNILIEQYMRL